MFLAWLTTSLSTASGEDQIPYLSSRPAAPKKIFLDFRGNSITPQFWNFIDTLNAPSTIITYRNDGAIPEFHPSQYGWIGTVANRDAILTDVWKMVADRYSMFNVNVTTVPPTAQDVTADNFIHVLFDDLPEHWYQVNNSSVNLKTGSSITLGFASRGSGQPHAGNYFTDSPKASRVCFTFITPNITELGSANARRNLAFAAIHEAAHMLGSAHDATLINPNRSIMQFGTSASGRLRFGWSGVFWGAENRPLNNFAKIQSALGNRPGEESDNSGSAVPLGLGAWSYFSYDGIIDRHDDVDFYTFTNNVQDTVTIRVSPKLTGMENGRYYHSTDTKIALINSVGTTLSTADPSQAEPGSDSTDPAGLNWPGYKPEVQILVPAGQYWIKVQPSAVMGAAIHGDLGQYILEAWR